jgi:hypothetical protein
MSDTKPISSPKSGMGCLIFIFAIFGIAGAFEFFYLFVPAAYDIVQAQSWTQVPCRIISSKVIVKSSQRSTNYAIAVKYSYTFAGAGHESDRYQFLPVQGFRNYRAKLAIVQRLRHGTWATCFVDPKHPEQAVIERGWTVDMWPVMGTSLVFLSVGILAPVFVLRRAKGTGRAVPAETEVTRGELLLKPRMGPVGALVGSLFMVLFFGGILSLFVNDFIKSWQQNDRQYGAGLFLLPFVCLELGLVVLVIFKILALFDPRPQLRLASGDLTPGSTTELRWQFIGRYDRISRLQMSLQGREEATFLAGKNSRTVTSIFSKSQIFESTRSVEIQKGKARLSIPPGTMHTLTATSNKIVWFIQLQAEIAGLPDLNEEFPLIVRPASVNQTRKAS